MKEEGLEVALKRGFLIPSNEIYGAISGFYDYGSIGAPMKRKIEQAWRNAFIWQDGNHEVETVTILPEIVLRASGHVGNFGDPLATCLDCKKKFRADTLVADLLQKKIAEAGGEAPGGEHVKRLKEHLTRVPGLKPDELGVKMKELGATCPDCGGQMGEVGWFNLMFKTNIGPIEGNPGYTRPETAQGIFTSFPRVFRAHGSRLPLGVAQIGKSFRNEISPRQGLIRLREFTQMELEYFFNPDDPAHPLFGTLADQKVRLLTRETQLAGKEEEQEFTANELTEKGITPNAIQAYFLAKATRFYLSMGVPAAEFRFRHMLLEETPHYSRGNFDLEVSTSYGWVETVGIAYRTDFDLASHAKASGQDLSVFIEESKKKIVPHVVEPSFGVDRLFWVVLEKAYRQNGGAEGRDWSWFDFPPEIAPFSCAVLPLMKKDGLKEKAEDIAAALRKQGMNVYFDASGSIGKRYARQDEIGTPYCMTVDYETLEKGSVTIRFRNDGKQERIPAESLAGTLRGYVQAAKTSSCQ